METKICTKCNIEKKITEFSKQKRGKFGVRSVCKSCIIIYRKDYLSTRHNETNEVHKEWKIKNKDYYKELHLKKTYNLSLDQYNQMLENQNGVCAICGNEEVISDVTGQKIKPLAVDHNHETREIRGLLCQACNTGLGKFKENKEVLKKAIKYLKLFNKGNK